MFPQLLHQPGFAEPRLPTDGDRLTLASGKVLASLGKQTIPKGDRLIVEFPGGGGYGDPMARSPSAVADDVVNGMISPEAARDEYGVVLTDGGAVDLAATESLRAAP